MNRIKNINWCLYLWITFSLLLIIIAIIIFGFSDKPKDPIDTENVRVYELVDSLSYSLSKNEIVDHNKIIIATLQEREATYNNILVA